LGYRIDLRNARGFERDHRRLDGVGKGGKLEADPYTAPPWSKAAKFRWPLRGLMFIARTTTPARR